jgi:hypothetical protein
MAAPKRPTHIVEHKNLFLGVEGKLQHFKKGTELTLTAAQAKKLGAKVKALGKSSSVDMTDDDKSKDS